MLAKFALAILITMPVQLQAQSAPAPLPPPPAPPPPMATPAFSPEDPVDCPPSHEAEATQLSSKVAAQKAYIDALERQAAGLKSQVAGLKSQVVALQRHDH